MYSIKVNQISVNKNTNQNTKLNINNLKNQRLKSQESSFESLLKNEMKNKQDIKFSKHAVDRLKERNIKLSINEVNRLNNAVNKAAEKGIKESLIVMDNKAFITSVTNKTVITAATDKQLKENVFTNIDGAIFA